MNISHFPRRLPIPLHERRLIAYRKNPESAFESSSDRTVQLVRHAFHNLIEPVVVGGLSAVGSTVNTVARGSAAFLRSVFSRS